MNSEVGTHISTFPSRSRRALLFIFLTAEIAKDARGPQRHFSNSSSAVTSRSLRSLRFIALPMIIKLKIRPLQGD